MDKKEILEDRKQAFDKLEKQLQENVPTEDRFFYYHSSEDRIVLSHALFWIMSRPMEKKLPSIEGFLEITLDRGVPALTEIRRGDACGLPDLV